jgi:sulfur carrier protein ThiS
VDSNISEAVVLVDQRIVPADTQLRDLADLQLTLVGGGIGDVVAG